MDFSNSTDEFPSYLMQAKRSWDQASDYILGLAGHWQELSSHQASSFVTIEAAPDRRAIQGSIFNKAFSLDLSPLTKDGQAYAEAILSVRKLDGKMHAIGSFLVERGWNIKDYSGALLVDAGGPHPSYKLYTEIVRAVIEESMTA